MPEIQTKLFIVSIPLVYPNYGPEGLQLGPIITYKSLCMGNIKLRIIKKTTR